MNYGEQTLYYQPKLTGNAHIRVIDGQKKMSVYNIVGSLSIGRLSNESAADCQIYGTFLSRMHGRIFQYNQQYYYEDLNSTNGTYINDVFYGRGQETMKLLEQGDIIRIGDAETMVPGEEPVIIIFGMENIQGDQWGCIDLYDIQDELCIGRAMSDGAQSMSAYVSRKHAGFFRVGNRMAIRDYDSLNGVFLNNRRIDKPCYLFYGDCVRITDYYFVFLDNCLYYNTKPIEQPVMPGQMGRRPGNVANQYASDVRESREFRENKNVKIGPQLSIYIEERSVFSKFKKHTLLKDVHMTVNSGEMVLILGGSGAGKTTFMNAVMGYEKAKGKIVHGEKDLYEDYDAVKYDIGFVPQQDLLRLTDSVIDTLKNAAVMKMPAGTKRSVINDRVDEVMEMLGLTREKNSLVQKLSGGQKKRLSIAVELISNPSLFFLDEPDSGLDGIMARSLMENLRMIADQGKIVMVITHGPDRASDLFDKVIVLAKSLNDNCGHLAFYGSVNQAFDFFECDSLEGVVRRINRIDEGGDGMSDYYIEKYAQATGMEG